MSESVTEYVYGIVKYGKVKNRYSVPKKGDVRARAETLLAHISTSTEPQYKNAHVFIDSREVTPWKRELLSSE